jgi:hypothetical protein
MKPSFRLARTAAKLSDSINRHLNMYSLGATAAGVGMLALSPPAEAKIIYTPANQTIDLNHPFALDLNHDGTKDFRFSVAYASTPSFFYQGLDVAGMQSGNSARGLRSRHGFYASRLLVGVRVGSKGQVPRGLMAGRSYFKSKSKSSYRGPWAKSKGTTTGYLGFRFVIKGKVHYGWARLKVKELQQFPGTSALLTGYAYETIANKTIITGKTKGPDVITVQPASLGDLARGASSISSWRVKRTAATTQP